MKKSYRLYKVLAMSCVMIHVVISLTNTAFSQQIHLRSKPVRLALGEDQVIKTAFRLDPVTGKPQEYVKNDFIEQGKVVIDQTTDLMWQQEGSKDKLRYTQALEYVEQLNTEQFEGYDDWRLPTIEELSSLVTPEKQSSKRYIDTVFEAGQEKVWSADTRSTNSTWVLNFRSGQVNYSLHDYQCGIRAVRTLPEASQEQSLTANRESTETVNNTPTDAEAYFERGTRYLHSHQYEDAIDDFSEAIQLDAHLTDAYHNRGLAYVRIQKYEKAIADYSKALTLRPDFVKAYNNRGNAYTYLQNDTQAFADYNTAIELDPSFAETYNNRGLAYARLQKYQEALADYTKAIEVVPNYANAYINRGNVHLATRQYTQAFADSQTAIELDPNIAEAYNNRGLASLFREAYAAALADLSLAIGLQPEYADTYANRAIIYAAGGRCFEAGDDIHRAQQLGYQLAPQFRTFFQQQCPQK